MPFQNEHACRVNDPDKYEKFARKNCDIKVDGKCVDVIYGVKEDDKSEIQAYRYPKNIWTEEDARTHCREHDGTFEPASDDAESVIYIPDPIQKPWYAVEAKDADVAEISIFDEIGGWWGVTVKQFKKDFDAIKNKKELRLLLNSPGGNAFDGMAVYNILAGVKQKLTVEVLGLAASVASIIALAGKELVMGEGSYLMIHNPYGFVVGDSEDMRRRAEVLEKVRGQLANIYTKNSNYMKEEVLEKMKEETWFTADEAVEAGFASSVVEYGDVAAQVFDFSKYGYSHLPGEVAEKMQLQKTIVNPVDKDGEIGTTGGEQLTLKENLEALSKLPEEERAKAIDEVKEQVAEIFGFTQLEEDYSELSEKVALQEEKIDLLLNENAEKSKELADLKRDIQASEKTEVIEKALSEGKIIPKNRDQWEEQYDKDPEGTRALLDAQEPVVDFSTKGTGAGGEETQAMSEEEKTAYRKMGLSDEQIKGIQEEK